nr:GGDEF domain-containing protein [Qipengyuania vesicularis]
MTVTDSLTDIANRRGLEQHFSDPVRRRPTGLALVDCDHFKRINDQFGHDVGDKVLCAVARGLEGDHIFAARLGGEEFVLLLYSKNWQEAAENARRRITQAVRDAVPELPYPITASAGLAALEATDSLASVMKRADRALYAAKEAGRNRSLSLTEFRPAGSLKLA